MEPHTIDLVSNKITKEMDEVKVALEWKINAITPESLLTWDVNSFIGPLVEKSAPILGHLLQVAAQTKRAKENKTKSCTTACNVIVTQLAKEWSQRSLYFSAPFTLFLWTNGASRQTIEVLHKCGLCISFSALTNLLDQLASQSLECARRVARGFHVLCWDNINIKMSTFVEQRDAAPAKVQSGTFAILYEISGANPTDMQLSPMLEQARQASDLTFNSDIRPTAMQWKSFQDQIRIHIIDILLACCQSFDTYQRPDSAILDHPKRRKMPKGHRTKQFPLRTSTIDESSVSGNIAVVNDVYITQLKITHEELSNQAVPSINDQSKLYGPSCSGETIRCWKVPSRTFF
ncbi:hypothetical protein HD554DRAFT_2013121 [Boletus coccyginus]|nr:hypothetical protein HD554DRAFT_2013121 [Boletus coccyginus]